MSKSLRIAVADDEAEMRDYLQETLSLLGHEVVALAESGQGLVEECRNLKPDLVISDVRMPDMDGIDAARQISDINPVPIILLSAFPDKESLERANSDYIMARLCRHCA